MKLLELDLNSFETEAEVHSLLARELQFPEYYGANLDALYDMLTSELDGNICIAFVGADEESPLAAFSRKLRRVLEDAAETVEEGDGKLYAVFNDKGPLNNEFKDRW